MRSLKVEKYCESNSCSFGLIWAHVFFRNTRNSYAVVLGDSIESVSRTRGKLLQLVTNKWFDRCIVLVVMLNCIVLAINVDNSWVTYIDIATTAVYSLEFLTKLYALGFCGKLSYFRDNWNLLDFVMLVLT